LVKKNKTTTKPEHPVQDIFTLAGEIKNLARVAARQYAGEVESILNEQTRAAARIEGCLDGLRDFCFHDEALALYKRLCRYYSDINPAATASSLNAYRELWDSPMPEKE